MSSQEEEWRPCSAFPRYQVSNLGSVRNAKTQRHLKKNIRGKCVFVGLRVSWKENKIKKSIGQLVLAEFYPDAFSGGTHNKKIFAWHKDGNHLNTAAANLIPMQAADMVKKAWSAGKMMKRRLPMGRQHWNFKHGRYATSA